MTRSHLDYFAGVKEMHEKEIRTQARLDQAHKRDVDSFRLPGKARFFYIGWLRARNQARDHYIGATQGSRRPRPDFIGSHEGL